MTEYVVLQGVTYLVIVQIMIKKQKVYISLVKVNNRQSITTVTGLDDDLDTYKNY